jgi:outer membrane lipoprotein-sorting protein
MSIRWQIGAGWAVVLVFMASVCWPCGSHAQQAALLTAAQIVEQMQHRKTEREQALQSAQATRHYAVEYRGFTKVIAAKMEVAYRYDAATGKSFRIISESGSKMLCDKVLKSAVESEKEASRNKNSSALTTANYKFRLVGSENLDGRPAYVLEVEPLTASKFLIRGKIWVDATDFALARVEAEPAKSPSFWIARTRIQQFCAPTGGFWLPTTNHSETKVRIGGTAVFTIDYGQYQIETNGPH